jgi:hypothetical protein
VAQSQPLGHKSARPIIFPLYPTIVTTGRVSEVAPQADTATGTYVVKVALDNPLDTGRRLENPTRSKKGPTGRQGRMRRPSRSRIEAVTRADKSEQVRSAQQQPLWRRVRAFERQSCPANGAVFYRASDAVECSGPHPSSVKRAFDAEQVSRALVFERCT